jgi:hypothetical protein
LDFKTAGFDVTVKYLTYLEVALYSAALDLTYLKMQISDLYFFAIVGHNPPGHYPPWYTGEHYPPGRIPPG